MVFPRGVQRDDGLARERRMVEIWNGMPFFSPVWARRPTVAWVHHVHDTMWEMTLPPRLARIGRTIEFRIAPPLYRRVPIVTLSDSSKRELVDRLHFSPNRVDVVPPGIDARFSPGGPKSPTRSWSRSAVGAGETVPLDALAAEAAAQLRGRGG